MLSKAFAIRYHQGMRVGKTKPLLMGCALEDGTEFEAVIKLSANCERGPTALAVEGIAAFLARDLVLPVPEPFAVRVSADVFAERAVLAFHPVLEESCDPSFGSLLIPSGFTAVADGTRYDDLLDSAAEIFAFDAAILNADRRIVNPNCQCNGSRFAIFDHEGALTGLEALGSMLQPYPWTPGALRVMGQGPGQHVLFSALKGREFSLDRLEAAWNAINEERLTSYKSYLPDVWLQDEATVDSAIDHLVNVRRHLPQLLDEVRRTLV